MPTDPRYMAGIQAILRQMEQERPAPPKTDSATSIDPETDPWSYALVRGPLDFLREGFKQYDRAWLPRQAGQVAGVLPNLMEKAREVTGNPFDVEPGYLEKKLRALSDAAYASSDKYLEKQGPTSGWGTAGRVAGELIPEGAKYVAAGSMLRGRMGGPAALKAGKDASMLARAGSRVARGLTEAAKDAVVVAPLDILTTQRPEDSFAALPATFLDPKVLDQIIEDPTSREKWKRTVSSYGLPMVQKVAEKALDSAAGRAAFEMAFGFAADVLVRSGLAGIQGTAHGAARLKERLSPAAKAADVAAEAPVEWRPPRLQKTGSEGAGEMWTEYIPDARDEVPGWTPPFRRGAEQAADVPTPEADAVPGWVPPRLKQVVQQLEPLVPRGESGHVVNPAGTRKAAYSAWDEAQGRPRGARGRLNLGEWWSEQTGRPLAEWNEMTPTQQWAETRQLPRALRDERMGGSGVVINRGTPQGPPMMERLQKAFGGRSGHLVNPMAGEGRVAGAVVRAPGQESGAAGDELFSSLTREGHAYRGMTADEFEATVGSGNGVFSRNDFSLQGEGTSFARSFAEAEDYANFGRTDPRRTGSPNYIVEVSASDLEPNRQGYLYGRAPAAPTRVWRVDPRADGALTLTEVSGGPRSHITPEAAQGMAMLGRVGAGATLGGLAASQEGGMTPGQGAVLGGSLGLGGPGVAKFGLKKLEEAVRALPRNTSGHLVNLNLPGKWYSRLERAVEGGPGRATWEEWQRYLNPAKRGFGAAELEFALPRGVKLDPDRVYTKQEVLDKLRKIGVQERPLLTGMGSIAEQQIDQLLRAGAIDSAGTLDRISSRLPGNLYHRWYQKEISDLEFARALVDGERQRMIASGVAEETLNPADDSVASIMREIDKANMFRYWNEVRESEGAARYDDYNILGKRSYREARQSIHPLTGSGQPMEGTRPLGMGASLAETTGFRSGHWPDDPNVMAHERFSDVDLPSGERALVVNEFQSDWSQAGRERGFGSVPSWSVRSRNGGVIYGPYTNRQDAVDRLNEVVRSGLEGAHITSDMKPLVPDTPYRDTDSWLGFSIRRAIAEAVQGGYDRIVLPAGEQVNKMFDLRKQVSSISWDEEKSLLTAYNKHGEKALHQGGVTRENLANYIGKGPAERLLAREVPEAWGIRPRGSSSTNPAAAFASLEQAEKHIGSRLRGGHDEWETFRMADVPDHLAVRTIEGDDLAVGGEGNLAFYNRLVPKNVRQELKALGVQGELEPMFIPTVKDDLPYRLSQFADGLWKVVDEDTNTIIGAGGRTQAEALAAADADSNYFHSAWAKEKPPLRGQTEGPPTNFTLRITPEIKEAAKTKGFRLYSAAGPLAGGAVGAQFGDTPEERARNAMTGATMAGLGTTALAFSGTARRTLSELAAKGLKVIPAIMERGRVLIGPTHPTILNETWRMGLAPTQDGVNGFLDATTGTFYTRDASGELLRRHGVESKGMGLPRAEALTQEVREIPVGALEFEGSGEMPFNVTHEDVSQGRHAVFSAVPAHMEGDWTDEIEAVISSSKAGDKLVELLNVIGGRDRQAVRSRSVGVWGGKVTPNVTVSLPGADEAEAMAYAALRGILFAQDAEAGYRILPSKLTTFAQVDEAVRAAEGRYPAVTIATDRPDALAQEMAALGLDGTVDMESGIALLVDFGRGSIDDLYGRLAALDPDLVVNLEPQIVGGFLVERADYVRYAQDAGTLRGLESLLREEIAPAYSRFAAERGLDPALVARDLQGLDELTRGASAAAGQTEASGRWWGKAYKDATVGGPATARTVDLIPKAAVDDPEARGAEYLWRRKGRASMRTLERVTGSAKNAKRAVKFFERRLAEMTDRLPHPTPKRVQQMFERGEADFDFYVGTRELMEELLGPEDADMWLRFLAATSPGADATTSNITLANKAFMQWKLGLDFDGYRMSGVPGMAEAATKGLVFGDRKVQQFYRALMGDTDAYVHDMWMNRLFGFSKWEKNKKTGKWGWNDKPTSSQYRFAEEVVRRIAAENGWTVRETQARMWGGTKRWWAENVSAKGVTDAGNYPSILRKAFLEGREGTQPWSDPSRLLKFVREGDQQYADEITKRLKDEYGFGTEVLMRALASVGGGLVGSVYGGLNAEGEDKAKAAATWALIGLVGSNILISKPAVAKRLTALWRAGLLSAPPTHAANALSNTVTALAETAKDAPAAAFDGLMVRFAKAAGVKGIERTKGGISAGSLRATARGLREGGKMAVDILRGKAMAEGAEKWDLDNLVNFDDIPGGKLLNLYAGPQGLITRALSAGDKPFKQAALARSLWEQSELVARREGLKGDAMLRRIEELMQDEAIQLRAVTDAETAVFLNEGKLATALQKGFEPLGPAGVVAMPFRRTPANITERFIEYSPIGVAFNYNDAVQWLAGLKKLEGGSADPKLIEELAALQRKMADRTGRWAVGSALVAAGWILSESGALTSEYPSDDSRERNRREVLGQGHGAVRVGDQWLDLSRISPAANLLVLGAEWRKRWADGGPDRFERMVTAVGKGAVEGGPLRGVRGSLELLTGEQDRRQLAGSVVPAVVALGAKMADPTVRDARTPLQTIQSRVPGLTGRVPARVDALGAPIRRPDGLMDRLGQALSPLAATRALDSADPVRRAIAESGASIPVYYPRDAERGSFEYERLQREYGREARKAIADVIRTQEFRRDLVRQARELTRMDPSKFDETLKKLRADLIEQAASRAKSALTRARKKGTRR